MKEILMVYGMQALLLVTFRKLMLMDTILEILHLYHCKRIGSKWTVQALQCEDD